MWLSQIHICQPILSSLASGGDRHSPDGGIGARSPLFRARPLRRFAPPWRGTIYNRIGPRLLIIGEAVLVWRHGTFGMAAMDDRRGGARREDRAAQDIAPTVCVARRAALRAVSAWRS